MKNLGHLIKKERKRKGISQKQLANQLPGIERTTISKYENGAHVPHDNLELIIEALRSPRLRLQAMGGAIPCVYLDKVDFHPVTVQYKSIEELEEAIAELKRLNLVNKFGPEDLSKKEQENLLKQTMMEIQDARISLNLMIISLAEQYNIDLQKLEEMSKNKMERKGYMSNKLEVVK